jgi:hypothetical protein
MCRSERPQSLSRIRTTTQGQFVRMGVTKPGARLLSRAELQMNAFLRDPVSVKPHARGAVASEKARP